MSHDPGRQGWFDRFLRWTREDGGVYEREVSEDPERAEFMEYLEYLDAHEHMEFGAYRLMRYREREARGMADQSHHHNVETHAEPVKPSAPARRRRRGHLRRMIVLYALSSVLTVCVLVGVLFTVVMEMPRFGDVQAPTVNEVSQRYLEQGLEETGALNAVAGMILDYRAFDTFGESTVLFASAISVILLLRRANGGPLKKGRPRSGIFPLMGKLMLPAVMMFGIYIVLNGHLGPGGGFSGGTVLGCGLILAALVLGEAEMEQLLPPGRITGLTVLCLLAYGIMKGYSFVTGANHIGWDIPKGSPGDIVSAGFILPLNLCVGIIVACTMYTFYTLFAGSEE